MMSLDVTGRPLAASCDPWCGGWRFGRAEGWRAGYRAGFVAGTEVGGAGVLLAVQCALPPGALLDLLPGVPYTGEWRRLCGLRCLDDRPCRRGCGACSRCVRAAAVAGNLARHASPDHPGGPVGWMVPSARPGRGAA